MIRADERRLLHQFIILDMAIKSLQKDYLQIENLKMSKVFIPIVDQLLKDIRNDFYNKKRMLAKSGIEVVKWVKTSEYFSACTIKTTGEDEVHEYANQALKTQVEELINAYLKK